jgi:hypothetical protein
MRHSTWKWVVCKFSLRIWLFLYQSGQTMVLPSWVLMSDEMHSYKEVGSLTLIVLLWFPQIYSKMFSHGHWRHKEGSDFDYWFLNIRMCVITFTIKLGIILVHPSNGSGILHDASRARKHGLPKIITDACMTSAWQDWDYILDVNQNTLLVANAHAPTIAHLTSLVKT